MLFKLHHWTERSSSLDIVKQDLSRESTFSGHLLMTFKGITVYLCSVFGLVVTGWNRGYPVLCISSQGSKVLT
jgi:hypothetical protein